VCFFFQAEDGIRDFHVTGVQTCALPISDQVILAFWQRKQGVSLSGRENRATRHGSVVRAKVLVEGFTADAELAGELSLRLARSGDRKSACRARVWVSRAAVSYSKTGSRA